MKRNFVFVILLIGALTACKKDKPKEVVLNAKPSIDQRMNELPSLLVKKEDGSRVSMKELTGNVLLVCYNPGCDHCQREAKQLSENKDMIKNYEVYFLTPEKMEDAVKFSKDYNLVEPNVHFVTADVTPIFNSLGAINTVPTFFIYRDQALIKRMEGEISMTDLRSVLLQQ